MVRQGTPQRQVARKFRTSLSTVQRWVERAAGKALDQVDWSDRPSGCRASPQRTKPRVEQRVLKLRKQLRAHSDLGEHGAEAIRRELQRLGEKSIPAARTIGRILERGGALDGRRRRRHPAPPPGWFLTDVASCRAEIDNFDIIEDLVIRGGHDVNVLTGISLHGGLCAAWPKPRITAKFTVECLLAHWQEFGLPHYAKFDNDTIFQGAHQWPDSFGRVTRLCLSLDVIPIFAPPLSKGFQADIEAFNRRWQDAVWRRFRFRHYQQLTDRSSRFVDAHRQRYADRIDDAPTRRPFPRRWKLNWQRPLRGTVIFLRTTNPAGQVNVLGHTWHVSDLWCNRLVRAEVDLTHHEIRCYALRRKQPDQHALLSKHPYEPPTKRFCE